MGGQWGHGVGARRGAGGRSLAVRSGSARAGMPAASSAGFAEGRKRGDGSGERAPEREGVVRGSAQCQSASGSHGW